MKAGETSGVGVRGNEDEVRRSKPGSPTRFSYTVPRGKTVPHLYPESELFQQMPGRPGHGFSRWLDGMGLHRSDPAASRLAARAVSRHAASNFSHTAATPPGLTIVVDVRLDKVEGRKLTFTLSAHDGVDEISRGTHERHVIDVSRFNEKIALKRAGERSS